MVTIAATVFVLVIGGFLAFCVVWYAVVAINSLFGRKRGLSRFLQDIPEWGTDRNGGLRNLPTSRLGK